uniref:Uncharacterized protein n=1 Tax=Manihot esculenta TaxID=3983 RepID=A0A2C9UJS6_MANES
MVKSNPAMAHCLTAYEDTSLSLSPSSLNKFNHSNSITAHYNPIFSNR